MLSSQRRSGRGSSVAEPGGLTFLDVATVLALVGAVAVGGSFAVRAAKKTACRGRARSVLEQVYMSQVLYSAVHGRFAAEFPALQTIGLPEELDPIYHFAIDAPQPSAFVCDAWANLDRDPIIDSLTVDETGNVRSLTRD